MSCTMDTILLSRKTSFTTSTPVEEINTHIKSIVDRVCELLGVEILETKEYLEGKSIFYSLGYPGDMPLFAIGNCVGNSNYYRYINFVLVGAGNLPYDTTQTNTGNRPYSCILDMANSDCYFKYIKTTSCSAFGVISNTADVVLSSNITLDWLISPTIVEGNTQYVCGRFYSNSFNFSYRPIFNAANQIVALSGRNDVATSIPPTVEALLPMYIAAHQLPYLKKFTNKMLAQVSSRLTIDGVTYVVCYYGGSNAFTILLQID